MRAQLLTTFLVISFLPSPLCASESASEWLAKSQEPDGHWDAKKYGASKQTDTIVTSLALLAFLGLGHSEKVGEFHDNVKRGVAWLKSKQDKSGKVFWAADAKGLSDEAYATALGTLVLCEAAAMGNVPETRDAAQKAVNYCAEVFPVKQGVLDKNVDTPIVGWFVIVFKSAHVAELKVPHEAFDAMILYLDSVAHETGAPSANGQSRAFEYWYKPDQKLSDKHPAHRLNAIGCLCRQFLGFKKEDIALSVEQFQKQSGLPEWTAKKDNVDLYYWWIATLASFQQGGDNWKRWNEALKKALLENQRKDGDDAHTWDPKGGLSLEWGRIGQTALACLCLEVYYRDQQLNPRK